MTRVYEPSDFPLSGQITRDYRVVRLLGKGGMGEVYLAEQLRVGSRLVALKVLNSACSQDPKTAKRFENEISAAGSIQHPNVVTVYESRICDDGQIYVAMEFIRGLSLRALLREREVLPLVMVVDLTKQICAGLGAAHKIGIVHRDIKPDNLMIALDEQRDFVVKVVDFGIARFAEMGGPGITTKDGVILGTPGYMSPEQAMGFTGDKIDARSDIYSVGMVVCEMLTGTVPFHGDGWMEVLLKHVNEEPPPPSEVRPDLDIPAQVDQVILKSLEKDPSRRQQTLAEFANELEEAYSNARDGRVPTMDIDPSREITIDVNPNKPRPPVEPDTKPEQRGLWVWARSLPMARKAVFLIGLAMIASMGIFTLNRQGVLPLGAGETLLEYRISKEKASASGESARVTTVKPGDGISFEVKATRAARLCVLYQDDYSFLIWLNPREDGEAQLVHSQQSIRVPARENKWILIDNKPRTEVFWVILIPEGVDWSLRKAVQPGTFSVNSGVAEIARDEAARVMSYLTSEGLELKSSETSGGAFALRQPQGKQDRVSFYRIELKHGP